jgi:uncharacterized protein (DUF2147 family)
MNFSRTISLVSTVVLSAIRLPAASPETTPAGLWQTVDDKTGKPRGIVRIYEQNGELFGKIEDTLKESERHEHCGLCTDERKDKPIIGLVIVRRLKRKGDEYSGGDILDPDTGTVYRCKVRLVENGRKLIVRGFVGLSLFGRSQTWTREPDTHQELTR